MGYVFRDVLDVQSMPEPIRTTSTDWIFEVTKHDLWTCDVPNFVEKDL